MAPVDEEKIKSTEVSSQNRPKKRVNKPLIEKRRRERINECLNQLQNLISQLDKDRCKVGRPAKLEKADILEMTVDFVRKTKSDLKREEKDDPDVHQQWYVAGFRRCMDEIKNFCTENNLPSDLKTSLQSQIDLKIHQLKNEQAVDLTTKSEKKESKLTEQLINSPTSTTASIQPKFLTQVSNSSVGQIQNTNVQIIQRPTTNTPGQVTVLCQKEPPTYVLLPTAALCQPIQIPNAGQGFPIIVQNSIPNYNIKTNSPEKSAQLFPVTNNLTNPGQVFMLPNSFSVPPLNTISSSSPTVSTFCSVSPPCSLTSNSAAYFPMTSTSLTSTSSVRESTQPTSIETVSSDENGIAINRQSQTDTDRSQSNSEEAVWRPW